MTTSYVVPCGTSVLDQLGRKLPTGRGSDVGKFVKTVTELTWLVGADLDDSDAVPSAWADKAAPKADTVKLPEAAPKRLSAETHSLATPAHRPVLSNGDRVILLASDTRGGVSAAFCVAHYLAGGDCAKLAYASTPEQVTDPFRLPAGQATVTVVRIRGLAPDTTDFSEAVAGIGKVLRAVWDTGATVEVHLTGGFKATLLHTLAMSEVLHSLVPERLSAWYVFEDIDTNSDQPVAPVPIGLREFTQDHTDQMRDELANALHHEKCGSRTFKGVGWRLRADGTRQLTDFGYGYLAILGTLTTSRGDGGE